MDWWVGWGLVLVAAGMTAAVVLKKRTDMKQWHEHQRGVEVAGSHADPGVDWYLSSTQWQLDTKHREVCRSRWCDNIAHKYLEVIEYGRVFVDGKPVTLEAL